MGSASQGRVLLGRSVSVPCIYLCVCVCVCVHARVCLISVPLASSVSLPLPVFLPPSTLSSSLPNCPTSSAAQ